MNHLPGTIVTVQSSGGLSLVEIDVEGIRFTSIVLRTPDNDPVLEPGRRITVGFNETETCIGKGLSGELSLRNRIPAVIRKLEKGELLTRIYLDFRGHALCSVITTRSTERMELSVGEEVLALVKTNEILLLAQTSEV